MTQRVPFVPVLMYHALEEARSPISCPPARFAAQMAWLAAEGFQAWTSSDMLRWLEAGGPPTRPAVLVTFDDGFRSVLRHGLPVLARYGFRATVFLVTGHVGGRNNWTSQPVGIPCLDILNWGEVRELAAAGMEIGAHSVTHARLSALETSAARGEILDARAAIEDALGAPIGAFAYPYGVYDARVRRLVRDHFEVAYTTVSGRVRGSSDRWLLPRVEVQDVGTPFLFRQLARPALGSWLWARGLVRRARRGAAVGRHYM